MKFVKPLQLQAYESLKEMILSGAFAPGQIYSETKLSQSLALSRTPMRDAIQRLAHEGYLDVIPSKGFCIHELTERDLVETYQIRCALEGFCAVQLARDHDQPRARQTLAVLEGLVRDQQAVLDTTRSIETFAGYDQQFHERIVYYLDNSVISETFDNYQYQMGRQITLSLGLEGRMEDTVAEHRAILDNMQIGAVGRSYKAALAHLEKLKNIIHLPE